MRREQFFDLIHRVSELTGIADPIIVGSHSLFAVTDFVPEVVQRSVEADFLLGMHGHEMIDLVRDNLGHWSSFREQQGYYADPLGMAIVALPPDWMSRLQPLKDDSGQVVARCLEIYDVAISKLIAGRDKDLIFLCNLLDGQLITMAPLMTRAETINETAYDGALVPRLERFEAHLRSQRHINYNLTPIRELLARLK